MQHEIDDRLARAVLSGEVRDGQTVLVDVAEGGEALALESAGSMPAGATGFDGPDDVIEAELLDE
ncbi:MAG: hypothetical protein KDB25_05200, partial [Leucobacter sp.]|nr:hypothetical protein [Leucobacter sp.]